MTAFNKTCCNCDKEFTSPRREAQFCETKCRKDYHNRAQTVGREMYHLVMAMRYSRAEAKDDGAWSLLCKLAEHHHNHDNDGKRRFDTVKEVSGRNTHLKAVVLSKNLAGRSKYAA